MADTDDSLDPSMRGILLADAARVLGQLGRDIEAALHVVRTAPQDARRDAEYRCAALVWKYFVQREAMGLRSHDQVIETLGIPPGVLAKVGATPPG